MQILSSLRSSGGKSEQSRPRHLPSGCRCWLGEGRRGLGASGLGVVGEGVQASCLVPKAVVVSS